MVIIFLEKENQAKTNLLCQSIIQFPFITKVTSMRSVHRLLYKTFGALYDLQFGDFEKLAFSIYAFSTMMEAKKRAAQMANNEEAAENLLFDSPYLLYDTFPEDSEDSEFSEGF